MRIFSGTIISCDEHDSVYKYLVEDRGRIVYVGNKEPHLPQAETVELGKRALLPAFGDGQIHFSDWVFSNTAFDVRPALSIEALAPIIMRHARKYREAKVLFGFGYGKFRVAEKRLVKRAELDKIIKERPVFLVMYDGTSAIVNTKAIGMLPTSIRAKKGFDLETGLLTREAFFAATAFFAARLPVPAYLKAMRRGFDQLASFGVGLVHTVEGAGFSREKNVDLLSFFGKGAPQQLRLYPQTLDLEKVKRRSLPRLGGAFPWVLDGSLGSKEAALLAPYEGEPGNRGLLFYEDKEIRDLVSAAHRQGLQLRLFCSGDRAVVQAVDALEAALKNTPRADHRHTLVQASLIPEDYLEKIAKLKIAITLSPSLLTSALEPADILSKVIGERALSRWPLKTMLAKGIKVSGASAAPTHTPNPISGLYGACNHQNPLESLSVQEALRLFTRNVAYTSFDEAERGSLEKGKIADLVVLNSDPLLLSPKDLLKLKVEKLYLSGVEHQRGSKFFNLLMKSIKNRSGSV